MARPKPGSATTIQMPVHEAAPLWSSSEDAAGTRETAKMPGLVRGTHPHQVARPRTAPPFPIAVVASPADRPAPALPAPAASTARVQATETTAAHEITMLVAGPTRGPSAIDDEPSDGVPRAYAAPVSHPATGTVSPCDVIPTAPQRARRAVQTPAAAPARRERHGMVPRPSMSLRRRPLLARPARRVHHDDDGRID